MSEVTQAIQASIRRVRRFFRDHPDWSKSRFALRAGIHRNSLINIDSKDWAPLPETLDKCEKAIREIEAEERKGSARLVAAVA